ncbi:MAG: hypothetical protein ACXVYL_17425 [Oryzihumus sp.]
MASVIIESFFVAVFVLAVVTVITLAVRGAIYRRHHPRTREERLADEHGDMDPDSFKLSGGPSWTGTSGGGGMG